MAAWHVWGTGAKAALGAATAAVAVAGGLAVTGLWSPSAAPTLPVADLPAAGRVAAPDRSSGKAFGAAPGTAAADAMVADPVTLPDAVPAAVALPEPQPPLPDATAPIADPAAKPPVAPPTLDLWRLDAAGAVQLAGRASPGAQVAVLIDTAEVQRVTATARGEFVADFTLPPGEGARLMTLVMHLPDGTSLASADPVLLLPLAEAPLALAEATAAPDAAPRALANDADTAIPGALPEAGDDADVAPQPTADADRPDVPRVPATVDAGTPPMVAEAGALDEPPAALPDGAAGPPLTVADASLPDALPVPAPADTRAAALSVVNAGPHPDPPVPAPEATTAPATDLPAPPAALQLGAGGVRVLTPGANLGAGPAPVSIDAISYAPDGAVQVAGRGMPGAVVRIYLDNLPLTALPVAVDGGWGGVLPGVAPGRYLLRADQLAADGRVTARFETPFQRETLEALASVLDLKLPQGAALAAQAGIEVQPAEASATTAPGVDGNASRTPAPQPSALQTAATPPAPLQLTPLSTRVAAGPVETPLVQVPVQTPDASSAEAAAPQTRPVGESSGDIPLRSGTEATGNASPGPDVPESATLAANGASGATPVLPQGALAAAGEEPARATTAVPATLAGADAAPAAAAPHSPATGIAAVAPLPAALVPQETPGAAIAVVQADTPAVAATPVSAETAPASPTTAAPVTVTVQPGFTLWAIAQGQYGDGVRYVQVFEANRERIRNPDLIYPGQVFTLPTPP